MSPEDYAELLRKGLGRPLQTLTDAERAALPRENTPPRPINEPHPAILFNKNADSRRYVEGLEHNQELHLCCRHVEESGHTAQWFATPSAQVTEKGNTVPDILVITCGDCGRNHTRFMAGGGDSRQVLEVR
jgi:hypothetical protein